jgi:uncharacterized membrane protein YgcG
MPDTSTWRNNLFTRIVLRELPIISSFVKNQNFALAIEDAVKCISSIAGGAAGMKIGHDLTVNSEEQVTAAAMVTGMIVGMVAPKIAINVITEVTAATYTMLHQYTAVQNREPETFDQRFAQIINNDVEMGSNGATEARRAAPSCAG